MKLKSTDIVPKNENLLIKIDLGEEITEDNIFVGRDISKNQVEYYGGRVLKLGNSAASKEQCPGLEENDYVICSQFAGYTPATEDEYCKLVRGHDVVAISTTGTMKKEDLKATNDRILVEIIEEDKIDTSGIYQDVSDDPREKQTAKGKVLHCGPNAEKIEEGTIVFFDPYVGNLIVNDNNLKLKTLSEIHILYTI